MKSTLQSLWLFGSLFLAVLLTNCTHDSTPEILQEQAEQETQNFQIITFKELPLHIQSQVSNTEMFLKKSSLTNKNEKPFGEIMQSNITKIKTNENTTSYTLGLTNGKNDENLYYDNLVVVEDSIGNTLTHIIRYEPEDDWYINRILKRVDYNEFSGKISFMDENGTSIGSVNLKKGEKTNNHQLKGNIIASRCDVLVEYAGLQQGGTFYVYSATYTLSCNNTGGSGGGYTGIGNDGSQSPGNGGSNSPPGGGGGGNSIPTAPVDENTHVPIESVSVIIPTPEKPINNINEFLECFDTSKSAEVTIYAKQPVPNSNQAYRRSGGNIIVGHTFVSIKQGDNISVFGFYPNGDPSPISPSASSILGNDEKAEYNVSVTAQVSGSILSQILQYSKNHNNTYNLNTYNCTDFAIKIGNLAGMNFPDATGSWIIGGGSNPGALGQIIRNMGNNNLTVKTSSGNAPSNNKGC